MTNLYIPLFGLLISLLTNVVFFSKKRIVTKETEMYKLMLITSLIDSIILSLIIFLGYVNFYTMFFIKILNKIDFVMYLIWMSSFYLYFISLDNNRDFTKIKKITNIINILSFILIILLPVIPHNNNGIMYVDGLSSTVLYVVVAFYLIFTILNIIRNLKNIFNKKYIPVFILIVIIICALIIRSINPTLIITSAVLSFINLIMYHTIENPDMKVLEELENNRVIIENNNEEKSNLLFKLSQEIRMPIKEIENISYDMLNKKEINDLVISAKDINVESKNLSLLVDNILDISRMDINKIKLYKNKFDIYKLYNEIILITKNNIEDNIEFKYNIVSNLPLFYGDFIKLKQIICSTLNYSISNTNNGFIELDIDAITNYDMCRLIITVKDTGNYIELNEINDIMSYSNNIKIEDNNLSMSLKEVNSMIKLLNGTFLIKSRKDKENVYRVVIDHEIDIKYDINNNKQVLLINDNYDELKEFSKILKQNNIKVTTSMYGSDSINRIRNNEKYDLIIIDDEMQPYNAVKTLEELRKLPKFKTKVIVLLGLNKEFIKEHYLTDYKFTDYLIKRNYKKEIERIIDKYL